MLVNNQWVTEGIIEEILKIHGHKRKWKHNDWKSMVNSKSSSKREVYNNKNLPQERRKSQKQPNLTPKGTRKRRTNKTQT